MTATILLHGSRYNGLAPSLIVVAFSTLRFPPGAKIARLLTPSYMARPGGPSFREREGKKLAIALSLTTPPLDPLLGNK